MVHTKVNAAFLLYRPETISERTPRLLGRTILCRPCNESGGSEVRGSHAHEQACSVMCINCHQDQSPRQGDARTVHVPLVVRGKDGHGAPTQPCQTCHQTTNTA